MSDISTLTLVAIVVALAAVLISVLVAVAKWMTRASSEFGSTAIWFSYEVAVDKAGCKYFISELPDGVQPLPLGYPIEIGPGLPSATEAWLKVPGAREVRLKLPNKLIPSDLDEGATIVVKVDR